MRGDLRCVDGRLWRHDPQFDDPDLETHIGQCPDCSGDGCGDNGEPVAKSGRSDAWIGRAVSTANCLQCGKRLAPSEFDYCDDCSAGQLED
jgi:hypothetical protein